MAVLSGKDVQAFPFGEPCSGMAHEIQMLAELLLLSEELQALLDLDPRTLLCIECYFSFSSTKPVVYQLT